MKAYYNENDPKAAAWLRELIKEGHIADGIVDERSIVDVRASDLDGYNQCHFFAGIGGWSYALRLAGWPDDQAVWTASCPCQPLSSAGKQRGHLDERHLWPAFYRLVAECRPAATFGEQVGNALGRVWLSGVRADLEDLGYAVGAADLCSAGIGSPNIRQRLYWVAVAKSFRLPRRDGGARNKGGREGQRAGTERPCDGERLAESNGDRRGEAGRSLAAAGNDGAVGDGGDRRLANAASPPGTEQLGEPGRGLRREPEANDTAERSGPCRLGDPSSAGSGRDTGAVPRAEGEGEGERREPRCVGDQPGDASAANGVADFEREGLQERRVGEGTDQRSAVERSRPTGGLAHSPLPEGERQPAQCEQLSRPSAWGDCEFIRCLDGKTRRIKRGLQPLVAGIPRGMVPSGDPSVAYAEATAEERVARLRGYGNSINPWLASEFIQASREAIQAVTLCNHTKRE